MVCYFKNDGYIEKFPFKLISSN